MTVELEPPAPPANGNARNLKVWVEAIPLIGGSVIRPTPNGVTAVVGANNSGKTTLLTELHYLLTSVTYAPAPKVVERALQIRRSGTHDDLLTWLHQHARWGRNPNNSMEPAGFRRQDVLLALHEINSWEPGALATASFWTLYFHADGYGGGFDSPRADVGVAPTAPAQVLYEQPDLMQRLSDICLEVFDTPLTLDDESGAHRLLVGTPDVPHPDHSEDKRAYRDALSRLEPLHAQGHGMRSWMSVITQLLTGTYPIILADEPEVFLHPPQARALGLYLSRLANEGNSQVILATHDRHLLTGLLEEGSSLSVARLVRTPHRTYAHQLPAEKVRELWADPVLRYSDVLDGLFHKAVVAAESPGDCLFYRAAAEHRGASGSNFQDGPQGETLRLADVMFAPSNGKQAMPKLISALTAVKVPVIAVPDLDVLNPREQTLQRLVEALGGEWTSLEAKFKSATSALVQPNALNKARLIRDAIAEAFREILEKDPDAVWDKHTKRSVNEVLRAPEGPSERLQKQGVNYAAGTDRQNLNELLEELASLGIVPVQVGVLERFAPELQQRNKTVWLEEAIENEAYKRSEAQAHIERCLVAATKQLESQAHRSEPNYFG